VGRYDVDRPVCHRCRACRNVSVDFWRKIEA
jgi:hypothetical protein